MKLKEEWGMGVDFRRKGCKVKGGDVRRRGKGKSLPERAARERAQTQ